MKIKLKPLAEQVVVVTGASSGIGLVTARRAAERGAEVMLIARSGDALGEIVGDINANGGAADWAVADIGDAAAVDAAIAKTLERFGHIDTWVNAAGVAIYGALLDISDEEHAQLFRTNYFGTVHCCKAAVPHLRHGGALITVGSIASEMPSPMTGAYAASKHATKAWVEALRMELGKDDTPISVTLVTPSGVDTPIAQHTVNHGPGEAQIPPPSYDPVLVADAILHCAEHQVPDVTAAATFLDPDKTQPGPGNLSGGVHAGRERSGEAAYTAAAQHPRTTTAVAIGLLTGAAALLVTRRGRRG